MDFLPHPSPDSLKQQLGKMEYLRSSELQTFIAVVAIAQDLFSPKAAHIVFHQRSLFVLCMGFELADCIFHKSLWRKLQIPGRRRTV